MSKQETSTRYHWPDTDALVDHIWIVRPKNGRAVAYIHASGEAEFAPQRQAMYDALHRKGWGTLSDQHNGKFVLRVAGINDGDELLSLLDESGYLRGTPRTDVRNAEGAKSKTAGEAIRSNSLRLSALTYMIGNAFYWLSGHTAQPVNADRRNMAIAFGIGDGALALFGGRDDAHQYKSLLNKLKQHMDQSGIEIPDTSSIHVETAQHNDGFYAWAYDKLHTNINSIKMMAEVTGGFLAFKSGLRGKGGKSNLLEMAGGTIVMAGWGGALLTREKKPDEEKLRHAGSVERLITHIQELPLRLAGYAGLAFNILSFINFYKIRHVMEGKYGLAAVGSMVASNSLYSISHKAPGGDIKVQDIANDVYSIAAQILNSQPENMREAAILSTAQFLGERTEIKDKYSEILLRLRQAIALQQQNPWSQIKETAQLTSDISAAQEKMRAAVTAASPGVNISKAQNRTTLVPAPEQMLA